MFSFLVWNSYFFEGFQKRSFWNEWKAMSLDKIFIVHPGSQNLRYGLASDTIPQTIPHCLARKLDNNNKVNSNSVSNIPKYVGPQTLLDQFTMPTVEAATQKIKAELPRQRIIKEVETFDKSNCTEVVDWKEAGFNWTVPNPKQLVYFGEQALRLPPNSGYTLFWPFVSGRLNVTPHYSIQTILSDLCLLWSQCFSSYLNSSSKTSNNDNNNNNNNNNTNHNNNNINNNNNKSKNPTSTLNSSSPLRTKFNDYFFVLIIPDQFYKPDVKNIITMMLNDLNFAGFLLIQESVAAVYGHGLVTGCVVDIGDQKISVCCVEEGTSLPNTRISLDFGGHDISRLLLFLLKNSKDHYFPQPNLDMQVFSDKRILDEIKDNCHLSKNQLAMQVLPFYEYRYQQQTLLHHFNVSEALILAPMSLFYPEILNFKQSNNAVNHHPSSKDDFEELYYDQILKGNWEQSLDSEDNTSSKSSDKDSVSSSNHAQSLHSAIIASIAQTGGRGVRKELKKKLCSNIVLIGGSSVFVGLREMIEEKVMAGLPTDWEVERLGVLRSRRKEMELNASWMSWRGGAIVATLAMVGDGKDGKEGKDGKDEKDEKERKDETTTSTTITTGGEASRELWIRKKEWEVFGIRYLKERSLFSW